MRIAILLLAALLALTGCPAGPSPEKIAELNEVVLAKEGFTPLKVGDMAPAFTATATTGERVSVGVAQTASIANANHVPATGDAVPATETPAAAAPTAGKGNGDYILLYFFPAGDTPNAAKHLRDFSKGSEKLTAAQIKVYGISTGSLAEHTDFAKQYGLTVPLLADTGAIARSYGTLLELGKHPQRTMVGIEPDGTIGLYTRAFPLGPLVDSVIKQTGRGAPK